MTLDLPSEARRLAEYLDLSEGQELEILDALEKVREEALAEGRELGRAEANAVYASMKAAEVPHE